MKKTGVLIMAVLSAAVIVFSVTVFADQSGLIRTQGESAPASKTEQSQEETKKEDAAKPAKKETKLLHGTGAYLEGGVFRYYENGVFKSGTTGVVMCPEDGKWRYVKNGISSPKTTGIVKRVSDGKWVYVKNGVFTKSTGVAKRLSDGKQLYVKKGVFSKTTGVAKRLFSKKSVYVKKGKFNKKTGLVQKQNKQWVFVSKGVVVTDPKKFKLTKTDKKAGRSELLCEVFARAVYKKAVKPGMKKKAALRACFNYLFPGTNFQYVMTRIPYYTAPDSAIVYTLDMIQEGGSTCHGFASLFAYMAKLCGYKNSYYCWSSYHGWAEINGLIYDPVFLGPPHNTEVYAITYGVGRSMGLGTDYVEVNRYKIPKFKDK